MTILIPPALLIFLLPGILWFVAFGRIPPAAGSPAPELPEKLVDAFGISFALFALAGMATFFLGLRLSGANILVLFGLILAVTLYFWIYHRPITPLPPHAITPSPHPPLAPAHFHPFLSSLLPLLAFALILVLRFYQARTLVLPAWVDSLHHTLLVKILLESGGLPRSLDPYLPVPLYYHAGFHANTALFAFLSRLSPALGILVFGQVLNALVALAVYRLGIALWNAPAKALAAMLLTGFVFQMPAYYLTWGRYTLLAGILLLALAMAAALDVIHSNVPDRRTLARLALLAAGLLLTHYFAALVLALFLGALAVERLLSARGPQTYRALGALAAAGAAAFLVTLPWTLHVLSHTASSLGIETVPINRPADEAYYPGYLDYLWYLLGPQRSHFVFWVGLAGLALLGWRRRSRPLAAWSLAFGLLSLPWGLNLAPFRPDHGVILAFLPASLHAADLLVAPSEMAGRRWFSALARVLAVLALGLLVYWGLRETRDLVNPVTILAEDADQQAAGWIAASTPPESMFFINTAHWQGGAYRGVDGGWWLPVLADRRTILPPVLYLMGDAAYIQGVLDVAQKAEQFRTCDVGFREFLQDQGVTHVYLKWGAGGLQPAALASCVGLRLVYERDGIYIFAIQH